MSVSVVCGGPRTVTRGSGTGKALKSVLSLVSQVTSWKHLDQPVPDTILTSHEDQCDNWESLCPSQQGHLPPSSGPL